MNYLEQVIADRKAFQKKHGLSELSPELTDKFEVLSCRLSPENLYCDGEISHAQARIHYKLIVKEWRALEKIAGRTVYEQEFPY